MSRPDRSLPLEGLKVADFSWVVAGPVVGRALADFGATVVRVESGTRIETARMMQPFYGGKAGRENSALYGTCNAGKYGVTLNLNHPKGRERLIEVLGDDDGPIDAAHVVRRGSARVAGENGRAAGVVLHGADGALAAAPDSMWRRSWPARPWRSTARRRPKGLC